MVDRLRVVEDLHGEPRESAADFVSHFGGPNCSFWISADSCIVSYMSRLARAAMAVLVTAGLGLAGVTTTAGPAHATGVGCTGCHHTPHRK